MTNVLRRAWVWWALSAVGARVAALEAATHGPVAIVALNSTSCVLNGALAVYETFFRKVVR